MARVFEHNTLILKMPCIERVTIEGENALHEIINPVFVKQPDSWTWTYTLTEMGHKNEAALVSRLKELKYKELI